MAEAVVAGRDRPWSSGECSHGLNWREECDQCELVFQMRMLEVDERSIERRHVAIGRLVQRIEEHIE